MMFSQNCSSDEIFTNKVNESKKIYKEKILARRSALAGCVAPSFPLLRFPSSPQQSPPSLQLTHVQPPSKFFYETFKQTQMMLEHFLFFVHIVTFLIRNV